MDVNALLLSADLDFPYPSFQSWKQAFSAEAATLPSHDSQLTEGDQIQTKTGGRLS